MALKDYLPDEITTPAGKVLTHRHSIIPGLGTSKTMLIERAKRKGAAYRTVKVLARTLRGKRDLRGNFYTPSVWLFSDQDLTKP